MNKEKSLIILISILVLLLSNLSFITAYLYPKERLIFLGRHLINSQDTYTYISFIEQAKQGRILFENLYTNEPQKPQLFRPLYILIGKFAKLTNLSSLAAYHIFRVILSIILFTSIYKFICLFFGKSSHRLLSFILLTSSSGFGFIFKKLMAESSDLWIPESLTFLSLSEAPHFILSLILIMVGFYFFLKFLDTGKTLYQLVTISSFLILGFEHPFDIVFVIPVILSTSILLKKNLINSLVISLAASVGLWFQYLESQQNPIMAKWLEQNKLLSPDPINFVIGFGLLIPLALIGIQKLWPKSLSISLRTSPLLITWVFWVAILLYSPFGFQRRFIEGAQIPLSILATTGMVSLTAFMAKFFYEADREIITSILSFIIIIGLTSGSIAAVVDDIKIISQDSFETGYYYYVAKEEKEALEFIKANSSFGDVILSNWFYGNLIPGLTGRKVFLGHKIQTANFDAKIEALNSYLVKNDPDQEKKFLKENNIKYIFIGINDSMIGYGFKPETKSYLDKVYNNNGALVYKLKEIN